MQNVLIGINDSWTEMHRSGSAWVLTEYEFDNNGFLSYKLSMYLTVIAEICQKAWDELPGFVSLPKTS